MSGECTMLCVDLTLKLCCGQQRRSPMRQICAWCCPLPSMDCIDAGLYLRSLEPSTATLEPGHHSAATQQLGSLPLNSLGITTGQADSSCCSLLAAAIQCRSASVREHRVEGVSLCGLISAANCDCPAAGCWAVLQRFIRVAAPVVKGHALAQLDSGCSPAATN